MQRPEVSDPCATMAGMSEGIPHDVHDLLEALRGIATSLTLGGADAFARNLELGGVAFASSPAHAVGMAAMISARRFEQINDARQQSGAGPIAFPTYQLLDRFPIRTGVVPACLDLIKHVIQHGITGPEPVGEFVKRHGLPGLMMLMQVYNEIGKMLVDADPELDSLTELMSREALADERDWNLADS